MNPYHDLGPGSFTGAGIDAATPLYDQLKAAPLSDGSEPESPEPQPDKLTGRQKLMAFFGIGD